MHHDDHARHETRGRDGRDTGAGAGDARAMLVETTIEVHRAHLMLTGMLPTIPAHAREHAAEALSTLEAAVARLRDVAARLPLPDQTGEQA